MSIKQTSLKAIIFQDDKLVVVGNRYRVNLPGGRMDSGDSDKKETLRRELREEVDPDLDVSIESQFGKGAIRDKGWSCDIEYYRCIPSTKLKEGPVSDADGRETDLFLLTRDDILGGNYRSQHEKVMRHIALHLMEGNNVSANPFAIIDFGRLPTKKELGIPKGIKQLLSA